MGTIHQRRWGSAIQSCVDGEAAPSRVAMVERHVADCADCAADLELFRRMREALTRLREPLGHDRAVLRLRTVADRISA